MARHIFHQKDAERTELLDQQELFVERGEGNERYFKVWPYEPDVDGCPFCKGSAVKTQNYFSKVYFDVISEENKKRVVQIEYTFRKFRCMNPHCGRIFPKAIQFADCRDHVTKRLENEIIHLVINGNTYAQISMKLQNSISRQAVGQIFNRAVRKKEALRKSSNLPFSLAILSGKTDKDLYTLFLNLDDGIRIYDIVYGVSSADITSVILRNGQPNVQMVLSDCNPTIVDTIQSYLSNSLYIIPVEYWFSLVSADFAEFAHEKLKWSSVKDKDALIMLSEGELGYRVSDLQRLLITRPSIRQAYSDYNRLRNIITRRDEMWVYHELEEWIDSVDPEFKEALSTTRFQLTSYATQISAHVEHRELVPERLYGLTSRLEELLSDMRTFSDEVLKARVLYAVESDLNVWRGVPLDEVIASLE